MDPTDSGSVASNPLQVLGVEPSISDEELRRRYAHLVRQHPPEREPAEFKRIRQAYEALRRPQDRARWALDLFEAPPPLPPAANAKARGPLGVPAAWWLAADPWSELGCRSFPADCRRAVTNSKGEQIALPVAPAEQAP